MTELEGRLSVWGLLSPYILSLSLYVFASSALQFIDLNNYFNPVWHPSRKAGHFSIEKECGWQIHLC